MTPRPSPPPPSWIQERFRSQTSDYRLGPNQHIIYITNLARPAQQRAELEISPVESWSILAGDIEVPVTRSAQLMQLSVTALPRRQTQTVWLVLSLFIDYWQTWLLTNGVWSLSDYCLANWLVCCGEWYGEMTQYHTLQTCHPAGPTVSQSLTDLHTCLALTTSGSTTLLYTLSFVLSSVRAQLSNQHQIFPQLYFNNSRDTENKIRKERKSLIVFAI